MRTLLSVTVLIAIIMLAACDDGNDDVAVAADPTPTPTEEAGDPEPEPTATPTAEPEPEPTPEGTVADDSEPTPTPVPAPADDSAGTPDDPVPLGETARVGEWEIQVVEAIPDAWESVPELQIINDPPEANQQFFMARLRATYVGTGSSQFWLDFELSAIDENDTSYDNYDHSCGIIPDDFDLIGQATSGEAVDGSICWAISTESAETLILVVENWLAMPTERGYFALTGD